MSLASFVWTVCLIGFNNTNLCKAWRFFKENREYEHVKLLKEKTMKRISSLKLKDLVPTQLDISEMGNLLGGIEGDIMPLAYGCENDVCTNDSSASQSHCTTESCRISTCTSGA